ncbi:14666_t:CDS:2, partial [Funneliformis mosseae]
MDNLLNYGYVSEHNHQISSTISSHYGKLARNAEAERSYDPPGELSEYGKRHDNDFVEISNISVIPTKDEVLCVREPFLPFCIPNAPHFLPNGAERLLDSQFSFIKRRHASNFYKGLKKIRNEYADLHVYTEVEFVNITCNKMKGFAYTLRFTPPKVRGSYHDRKAYWEKSRRLLNVSRDEKVLAKHPDYADIDMIENSLEERFMVESTGVYFEAYNHVLNTLKSTTPSSLPFVKYFAPNSDRFNHDVIVKPPLYARAPGFHFDLSVICDRKQTLKLNVENPSSYDE